MPYKGEQIIEFPNHQIQNVMLVYGDNMRGKTSFLNAIRWCFYGKAIGRHLRTISTIDLVNIDAAAEDDWNVEIKINFTHNDHSYELIRRLEKKEFVSTPTIDANFTEIHLLKRDGKPLNAGMIQNEINQIIPEEISRFFLFDGELLQEYENLLLQDVNIQGKSIKDKIEQVLGVPALTKGKTQFTELLNDASKIQRKELNKNKKLEDYGKAQNKLEEEIQLIESDNHELMSELDKLNDEITRIDEELKNSESFLNQKDALDELKNKKNTINQKISAFINDNILLFQTVWKDIIKNSVKSSISDLKEKREELKSEIENNNYSQFRVSSLLESIDKNECINCEQSIQVDTISELRTKAKLLQNSVLNVKDSSDKLYNISEKIERLGSIDSADESERILKNIKEINSLKFDRIGIETKIDDIHSKIKDEDTTTLTQKRDKLVNLRVEEDRLNQSINTNQESIDKKQKEYDTFTQLISNDKSNKGELSSIRVRMYQSLVKVFDHSIVKLRDSLKTTVADLATSAFKQLTTETTYKGLKINENYGLSIRDQEGRNVNERSAGAEQIVALALIDGLNKTARNSGPIIMDTPFGRLDLKHRSNVLKYLPKMADQIILLVHEGEINPANDLEDISAHVGCEYIIERISSSQSKIKKKRNE